MTIECFRVNLKWCGVLVYDVMPDASMFTILSLAESFYISSGLICPDILVHGFPKWVIEVTTYLSR